jgi:hypothetical protein
VAIDPANRWVWRHSPRRLEAEEIRDATLAAAGKLNLSRPAASPAKDFKVQEMPNNGPVARKLGDDASVSVHRSVYLPLLRGLVPISLEVFDFAEQGMVTGNRDTTTVATQALYLMNDPFVRRHALQLAERVLEKNELDDAGRVALAYRLTVGRAPTTVEVDRVKSYLADYETASAAIIAAKAAADAEAAKAATATASVVNTTEAKATAIDSAQATTDATTTNSTNGETKKPPVVIDPDEIIPVDAPITVEVITAKDQKAAAWASFCQALLGTAEFRYLK